MAGDISQAALKFAKKRAAVVAFSGVTGRDSMSGAVVSARLAQRLLAGGSVDVVERDVLDRAYEERTGSARQMTPGAAVALGREMGIDAVIAGTVFELKDGRIEVNARMIDTKTGRVIAATSGKVDKDWSNFDDNAAWDVPIPPMPSLDSGRVVNVSWDGRSGRRVEISDCPSALEELNGFERDVVDIKARF
jgi:TolB-like protein